MKKTKIKIKGEKKILLTVFKLLAVIVLLVVQISFMLLIYSTANGLYKYASFVFDILKLCMVLYILYNHTSLAYKISWILFITFLPVVGVVAYFLWGNSKLRGKKEKKFRKIRTETTKLLNETDSILKEIEEIDKYKYNQVRYMQNVTGYPLYKNEGLEYFELGEKFFDSLKKDLLKAKKYILMEFYILSSGKLWDEIFEILKKKAKDGVNIKIIIDSLGCIKAMPKNIKNILNEYGIEVEIFNPPSPIISGYINYRDHRKIVVIDGIISYTGGVNIADEYVNAVERFGHWKDVGIKIKGEPSWSFALMFLRNLEESSSKEVDYEWYKKITDEMLINTPKSNLKGYVLPFCDGPDNFKNPIESMYIQTINYAKEYVYITTPYFIISEELLKALLTSARSGVDIRVILPHIPDKKLVQIATRSYYDILLEAGVKVYEYEPGFIHSKTFVVDDEVCIVGTANLDFRSTHLNFECLAWTYKTGVELDVKKDFLNILDYCIEIDKKQWKNRKFLTKIAEAIISAFSPML
ncbi:MAG: cardiolipin synthase [Clostridia bacterium]